jgi:hypothetical protein
MPLPRPFLLGFLALGLSAGLATAQVPAGGLPAVPPAAALVPALPPPVVGDADGGDADGAGPGRAGLLAGAGLYLLQPYFDNNPAYALQTTVGRSGGAIPPGSPGTRIDTRVDVSNHMEAAPLVWLGYLGDNGLGGRVRWWYFRQGTSQSATAPAGADNLLFSAAPLSLSIINAGSLVVQSKLELQVFDVEGLYDLRPGCWDLLFGAGVRIARVSQEYNASTGDGTNRLFSGQAFQGAGPTLALEARRPFGLSGLALYTTARGSAVFGGAHQTATLPDRNQAAQDHRDPGLAIGELELGLEYGVPVGRSWLFGQVGLVGQEWVGVGGASRSSVNVLPGGGFVGASYTADGNLAFLGLLVRLGLNY